MTFVHTLRTRLDELHLLKHPFYQAWTDGTLKKETLKKYASQYYQHVSAFPRYISRIHSQCENPEARQLLLENLNDEEGSKEGATNHPELWKRFAEGLGCKNVESSHAETGIQNVIRTFFEAADSSYEEGLGALYAYESQIPEIAKTKIEGLKAFYKINSPKCLEFFEVHLEADVYHREACEKLLNQMPKSKQAQVEKAALRAAKSLWDFLSDMYKCQQAALACETPS